MPPLTQYSEAQRLSIAFAVCLKRLYDPRDPDGRQVRRARRGPRHRGAGGTPAPRLRLSEFETEQGLEAAGTLDLSTELGKRVHQLIKAGSLSWSIGFVVPEGGRRRRNKITEITEVDLAEVSVVATPANRGARTLSIKAAQPIELVSFEVA